MNYKFLIRLTLVIIKDIMDSFTVETINPGDGKNFPKAGYENTIHQIGRE